MGVLEQRGCGFPVGVDGGLVVPIVPAAVFYDLGRGGAFGNRPDEGFGRRAALAARPKRPAEGAVGAGTGAVAGGLQGGVGTASITLATGDRVAAIAVVNSAGSVIDPRTCLPFEYDGLRLKRPSAVDKRALREFLEGLRQQVPSALNTTIGVVATSAGLTKTECTKLAGTAHDGLARAVRPAHSMFDGDTIFTLSTGVAPQPPYDGTAARARAAELEPVLQAGAHCFALACTRAVLAARSFRGGAPAYIDLYPSAL